MPAAFGKWRSDARLWFMISIHAVRGHNQRPMSQNQLLPEIPYRFWLGILRAKPILLRVIISLLKHGSDVQSARKGVQNRPGRLPHSVGHGFIFYFDAVFVPLSGTRRLFNISVADPGCYM